MHQGTKNLTYICFNAVVWDRNCCVLEVCLWGNDTEDGEEGLGCDPPAAVHWWGPWTSHSDSLC